MTNILYKIFFVTQTCLLAVCCNLFQKSSPHTIIQTDILSGDSIIIKEIDLQKYYAEFNLDGMFALYDPETKVCRLYNKKFLHQSITPASTFNVTTTLISLEEGILKDEKSEIQYDGFHKSRNPESNMNLPIKYAFQRNIDWVFLKLCKEIGNEKLKNWVEKLKFGNMEVPDELDTVRNINGKSDVFWVVPSTLRITPSQQLQYMQDLRNEKLPFSKPNIQTVKKMMFLKDVKGYNVFGKQGSYLLETENKYIGWHIGWIEKNDKPYYYINYLQTKDLKHPTIVNAQKEIPYKIFENLDNYLINKP